MKLLIAFCVAMLIVLSTARPEGHSRGCIYIIDECYRDCEVGTHGYSVGCGYKIPEPTCDQPIPVKEKFMICDYSACYCDPPTVRDTASDKCVPLDQCPKKA